LKSGRLSAIDAIFYYSDNRRVAMQASVAILVDGPVDFARYRDWLAPRVEAAPKLRMALRAAPLDLLRYPSKTLRSTTT